MLILVVSLTGCTVASFSGSNKEGLEANLRTYNHGGGASMMVTKEVIHLEAKGTSEDSKEG